MAGRRRLCTLIPWGCALGSGEGRQAGMRFSVANRCLESGGQSDALWGLLVTALLSDRGQLPQACQGAPWGSLCRCWILAVVTQGSGCPQTLT